MKDVRVIVNFYRRDTGKYNYLMIKDSKVLLRMKNGFYWAEN